MKRIITVILSFVMLLSLASCGTNSEPAASEIHVQPSEAPLEVSAPPTENAPKETEPAETTPPKTSPPDTTIPESVIYEDADFKVTITGFDNSDLRDVKINMLVENYTGKNIVLSANHFVVNGIYLWCDLYIKVAAEKKANGALEIGRDDMALVGVDQIATIFTKDARFVDTDTYETLTCFSFELSSSIADTHTQKIDESGTVVFEQDGIQIKYRGFGKDRYERDQLSFYIMNTTDKDVIVTCDNVSVNGFTVYGDLLARSYSNTVCYDYMGFSADDLRENGINTIENVTFNFRVYEQETYSNILKSDSIEIILSESPAKEDGIISLGNFSFNVPDGFEVADYGDTYFTISSSDGECAIGFTATDISMLDEESAKAFLPLSHDSFVSQDTARSNEAVASGAVADFKINMDYYLNASNSSVNLVGTFTDSWFAYTVKFVCKQDGDKSKNYIDLFAEFCVYAKHSGAESRFDFVQ